MSGRPVQGSQILHLLFQIIISDHSKDITDRDHRLGLGVYAEITVEGCQCLRAGSLGYFTGFMTLGSSWLRHSLVLTRCAPIGRPVTVVR